MPRNRSRLISRRSASELLFLLSGEETTIPEAEARALTAMQDPSASFRTSEERILIATTTAAPAGVESRIAYSRRVGTVVPGGRLEDEHLCALRRGTYAIRVFDLRGARDSKRLVARLAGEINGRVELKRPDTELTVVRAEKDYLAVTRPSRMRQNWVTRRPRARAFFHPSAIFPKFARALVNLSRVAPGQTFLDPFSGTGSLLLEAAEVGALPVGVDLQSRMVAGALRNRDRFGQEWLGVVRADSRSLPISGADGIATDIPYGRVSTTSGSSSREILESLIKEAEVLLAGGRRLVVMHPESLELTRSYGFEVEEQHRLPVHKTLTRVVTVLRRS